ncbi:MAG: YbhN family protein [Actinomycetota bacterium]|nr:YbhN family protein [Actinomycetota bacterium]
MPLTHVHAVGVTAVTIVAQAVAATPGGIGSYEAAGTAGLVALGVPVADAFAVVLATHAVKTAYARVVGSVALLVPAPGWWGRWAADPAAGPTRAGGVRPGRAGGVSLPAHDEQDSSERWWAGCPPRSTGDRCPSWWSTTARPTPPRSGRPRSSRPAGCTWTPTGSTPRGPRGGRRAGAVRGRRLRGRQPDRRHSRRDAATDAPATWC